MTLSLVSTPEEVREVQHLRYKVFVETMGLSALVNAEEIDMRNKHGAVTEPEELCVAPSEPVFGSV